MAEFAEDPDLHLEVVDLLHCLLPASGCDLDCLESVEVCIELVAAEVDFTEGTLSDELEALVDAVEGEWLDGESLAEGLLLLAGVVNSAAAHRSVLLL